MFPCAFVHYAKAAAKVDVCCDQAILIQLVEKSPVFDLSMLKSFPELLLTELRQHILLATTAKAMVWEA